MRKNPSFPRRRESSVFIQCAYGYGLRSAEGIFFDWIPACAGMTQWGSLGVKE